MNATALLVLGVAGVGVALLARQSFASVPAEWSPPEGESLFDQFNAFAAQAEFTAPTETASILAAASETVNPDANIAAFLRVIRYAEGTAGDNGYRTMFGGGLFDSFDDHPRQLVRATLGGKPIASSAAGAYQAMPATWDDFIRARGPHDFSPASQDEFALWAIQRRGALEDVKAGRFDVAISKVAKEWASLPGSPYGQPVKSWDQVRSAYLAAGGAIA